MLKSVCLKCVKWILKTAAKWVSNYADTIAHKPPSVQVPERSDGVSWLPNQVGGLKK